MEIFRKYYDGSTYARKYFLTYSGEYILRIDYGGEEDYKFEFEHIKDVLKFLREAEGIRAEEIVDFIITSSYA